MNHVRGVAPAETRPGTSASPRSDGESFRTTWRQTCARHGLKFSRHAMDRIRDRQVDLDASEIERLGTAVNKAQERGARDSLVLLDELAFVVSVKNRTVVTAMQKGGDRIFTAIDSAVIA